MDTLLQDFRYALRRLRKDPAFAVIAVITLAIGIGANSAIFSVVNGVLLKPLPYPEPDRLVRVSHLSEGHRTVMSPLNFLDWKAQSRSIENAAAYGTGAHTLTGAGEPIQLDAADVSASFFDVLEIRPVVGRGFTAEENTPGHTAVVVLSYTLWQTRFGGDRTVVGRTITLDDKPYTVVGVAPAGFSLPAKRDLWTPLEYDKDFLEKSRGAWYLGAVGRLKPGVSVEAATAEAELIGRRLSTQYPGSNALVGITLVPLKEDYVGDTRPALLVMLGAVGFVLLIACVNVANLLLARATVREGELAVRTAIGASRARLVRQLVTESVIVSLAGGGGGLLLASWATDSLVSLQPRGMYRLDEVHLDATVLVFTFAVSVLTGLLFGTLPALHVTRGGLTEALKEGARGAVGGSHRLRGSLVVAEMALALTLLAGAGLLARSFIQLQRIDPGYRPDDVLTFRVALPGATNESPGTTAFFSALLQRVRALPGVERAGATMGLPLSGLGFNLTFAVKGRPPVQPGHEPAMEIRVVTPGYFETMGIALKRGRLFTDADRRESARACLITESAARQFFPGEDPIGRQIELGWRPRPGEPPHGGEVVGIVADVKELSLSEENPPQLYMPHAQAPVPRMDIVMRTSVPPRSLAAAAERAVHDLNPNLPVTRMLTLEQVVAQSVSQPRFYLLLLGIFAIAALALAAIGIFGVISCAVVQRTREIGIRLALGADRGSVLQMVVRQAMLLAGLGVGCGLAASLALSRALRSLLFQVSPTDPATYAAVGGILLAVALIASSVPAFRATRVDPAVALRGE